MTMIKKLKTNKNPEPPKFKSLFYEDWMCAILYFKESLAKIENILKLEKNLRGNAENSHICQWLIEFSVVLLVSAFEWYCFNKILEIDPSKKSEEIKKKYNFQNPADCNRAFKEIAGIEVLKVWNKGDPKDQDKLRRMKILAEKRHCIIHRSSRVSSEIQNLLNQKVPINAPVPLDNKEIKDIMEIMEEFVLRVENQHPSRVDWRKEGLKL